MNKLYLRGKIKCLSPLAVGSGLSEFTDHDVLTDENGNPFIPGSSIAGVCRHYLESVNPGSASQIDSLFGEHFSDEKSRSQSDGGKSNDKKKKNKVESRITFFECFLSDGAEFKKGFRDGVRIDDEGVAEKTGKFDYEIFELKGNAYFDFRAEIDEYCDDDKPLIEGMISGINNGSIRVGHKTTRGLGKIGLFDLKQKKVTDIQSYIDFEWNRVTDSASEFENGNAPGDEIFVYSFVNTSFLTVANNATLIEKNDEGLINSEPLKSINDKPVIPGTSWAGIFKSNFKKILTAVCLYPDGGNAFLNSIFGTGAGSSKIIFDVSELDDANCMLQTRNAIDRFTGGAGDKKLFTNQLAFGGKSKLVITLKSNIPEADRALIKNLIDLTVRDFNDGSLNIGALGSIGAGILKLTEEGSKDE